MPQTHVTMAPNGRLVIPARIRAELGMQGAGNFVVHVENGQIRLEPIRNAIARARALVRQYVPEGIGLADELSEDRRREAERE